jgi:hypothetical protein
MLQVDWFKIVQVSIFQPWAVMFGFNREQLPRKQEEDVLIMQSPTLQGLVVVEPKFPMKKYQTQKFGHFTTRCLRA